MKSTGIVRRIDDLGRIVIPKEIRRVLRIRSGENIEIFVEELDKIVLKKHSSVDTIKSIAVTYAEAIYIKTKKDILITDRDKFIAIAGSLKKKYLDKKISSYLEDLILRRVDVTEKHEKKLEIIDKVEENCSYMTNLIIADGDVLGMIIIISQNEEINDEEESIVQIAANFLSKYVSD